MDLLNDRDLPSVVSAADGSFTIPAKSPTVTYGLVRAVAEGGRLQGIGRMDARYQDRRAEVRIVLRLVREVEVRVTDADGGGIEGAAVEVFDWSKSLETATTDAAGIARLAVPADAEIGQVVALKPGVGFDYQAESGGVLEINGPVGLVLHGVRTIRVRAVDAGTGRCPASSSRPGQSCVRGASPRPTSAGAGSPGSARMGRGSPPLIGSPRTLGSSLESISPADRRVSRRNRSRSTRSRPLGRS